MNDAPLGGVIRGKTHVLPVRIYYEDTDLTGIVYHANYLRYLERGRSDFLRLMGIRHRDLLAAAAPIAWTVVRMELDFLRPAHIEETLEVHTAYTGLRGARLFAVQAVKRNGEELVKAKLEAACIRPDGRPTRVPVAMRGILADFLTAF